MSAWGKAWGFAWGNAWGLFQTPYADLTGAEKVFVRAVLDAVWSQQTVEQIVSVATLNRISVLDAATVLRIVDVENTLVAAVRSLATAATDTQDSRIARGTNERTDVVERDGTQTFATERIASTSSKTEISAVAARQGTKQLFVQTHQHQEISR